jgi:hypothetical protein
MASKLKLATSYYLKMEKIDLSYGIVVMIPSSSKIICLLLLIELIRDVQNNVFVIFILFDLFILSKLNNIGIPYDMIKVKKPDQDFQI